MFLSKQIVVCVYPCVVEMCVYTCIVGNVGRFPGLSTFVLLTIIQICCHVCVVHMCVDMSNVIRCIDMSIVDICLYMFIVDCVDRCVDVYVAT